MGPQLYSRRDVRRLMAALGVFVVVPCALLVFLAWQSVHSLHEIARTQRRDACRRELRDLGLNVRDRLANWLARAGEPLRARPPADPSFWIEAMRSLGADPGIRTVLALDPAGNLAGPWNGKTPTDDLPRLSSLHPAHAALRDARRARWIDGDPARALERYRQVVDEPRTPPAVRLGVWAEMAQCEQQRGDVPAALENYDRMLAAAENLSLPALALLRAVELAQEAGDAERARRGSLALLETCERRGMEMDLDELEIAADRLRAAWTEMPDDLVEPWGRVKLLAKARAAREAFVHTHGTGPFPFRFGAEPRGFEAAELPRSAGPEPSLVLVDVRAALADGSWLAFEIDLAEFRAGVLEPALRAWAVPCGGSAECVATPAPEALVAADSGDRMIQPLPAPLDFWALDYRIEPSSMWATLAASRTKTRAAILGFAAALALLGLVVPFSYMRRSLRLAGLQADVMDRISHELKTPITSLAVLADTLDRRGERVDPAADRQLRVLMRDEVRRLVRLSNRLLDFSRQRAGTVRLDREPGQLAEMLAAIVRSLPAETGLEAGRLAFDVQPADYAGEFDREALGEIARNLVENAVKYGEGPVAVRISLRRAGRSAVLAVADNGRGMDAHTLRRLFTPYFRADNHLAARVPGLGLGLSIVRGLVRAHGGSISVRSAPGQGSTFEIRLPLSLDSGGCP